MVEKMSYEEFIMEWNSPSDRILVHTSGSTGAPKPICVEKRRMLASARQTCDFLGLKPGDSALLCMSLDYIAGKMMAVRSIERGLELCVVPASNHPLAGLEGRSIDFVAMVPSQVYCSMAVPSERDTLRHIRHLIIGGGAISAELQLAIDSLGSEGLIWSTYGMTETLSHIAMRPLNGPDASEWYAPLPGVGVELGSDGCLMIDAPQVCEGILHTNDIAELREGQFRIIGRKDNVICSGGIKLQIETIEEKLRPFITVPFCITKRKDPKFGEAAVLLLSGERLPQSALDDAFAHLERYERPKDVCHVECIPMTRTGKIDRASAISLLCTCGKCRE